MEVNQLILNANVKHEVFGIGILKKINKNIITINFRDKGEKKFIYPDVFEKFLVISDPALNEVVTTDISNKKAEIKAEKALIKQRHEEEILAQEKKKPKKRAPRKTK